ADVTATCTNPAGENRPPGQNPAAVTVSGSEAIPAGEIKNGTTPFAVETVAPPTLVPGAPGCPNTQWTETITDLSFPAATVAVEQPPGPTVLTVACSISPASAGGSVPAGAVSCAQS